MNHAIFILGMHRSGTSALARVVNLLGADLGNDLMAAAEDNQKGFFEHELIVQIHEQLLTELGLNWYDGLPLPDGWLETEAADTARTALAEILDNDFSESPLWAIKDPRQCRLMPLWIPLLEDREIEPHFIIAYRHPLEVAASLHKRDGMDQASALLCWLSYTLEALLAAQGHPQTILSYDELLEDWQGTMTRAASELNLDWPTSLTHAAEEINRFLSPELRNHKQVPAGLGSPYDTCLDLLQNPSPTKLKRLLKNWKNQTAPISPLLREARFENQDLEQSLAEALKEAAEFKHRTHDLEQQFQTLQQHLKEVETEATRCEAQATRRETMLKNQLEAIYESSSWKATEPMRKLKGAISGGKKLAKQDDKG
ncbi:MAG: hypothetical protein P8P30_06605 [Rickettsiales bacterium]|nr:hypothetical protein [Rickettsiales bacterium]